MDRGREDDDYYDEDGDDEEEEEPGDASSSDEGYNMANYGIAQALPVPDGPPPDLSAGPPQTAEEYLQWVRYEAQQRPNVVRTQIDPRKVTSSQPSRAYFDCPAPEAACQEWARPSAKWVAAFIGDFAALRRNLLAMQEANAQELAETRLPDVSDRPAWEALCFGQWQPLEEQEQAQAEQQQRAPQGSSSKADSGGTDRILGPVLRTVLALDQLGVAELLQRHVEALSSQPELSYMRSQWLFALSAVLQRPLAPDVSAAYRTLVRRCAAWRAGLPGRGDPSLPRLNVLMAIAGGYFGQDEVLAGQAAAVGDLP